MADQNPVQPQDPSTVLQLILAQMQVLTARVESQQTILDGLQHLQAMPTEPATVANLPEDNQDIDPNDPSEEEEDADLPDNAAQHGIRAVELWKTDLPPNKEPFKPSFKLDNANDYSVWQFSMRKFLEKDGLLPFVLGTARRPVVSDPADLESVRLYQRWLLFNTLAETAILSSVGKSQLSFLTRCNTPSEMWNRLKNQYQHESEVNVARLEDELSSVKWKRSDTLKSYIQNIDRLADLLRGCGQEVSESRLRMSLLKGLPDRLISIRHILLQVGPLPFHSMCDHLRSHVGLSHFHEHGAGGNQKAYIGEASETVSESDKPDALACSFCQGENHTLERCNKRRTAERRKKIRVQEL